MNTLPLTFNQAKSIITELGRHSLEDFIESMNDQPEFLKYFGEITDVAELISLYECGCASNAHRACYYHDAEQCMIKHSDSIESQLEDSEITVTWDIANDTFSSFCSTICVLAVEDFVSSHAEILLALQTTEY